MKRRGFVSVLPTVIGMGIITSAESSNQKVPSGKSDSQDHATIAQIVVAERWARDMAQWDVMRAAYHPGAMVEISWFTGPATEFVNRSKQSYERGARSLHLHGPVLVDVQGDRATAEIGAMIMAPGNIKGVECVTQSYARLVERLERHKGKWGITLFQAIYQMETITAVNPAKKLDFDEEKLASYRPSYRYLTYLLMERNTKVRLDLPGIDKPESVEAVYQANRYWLKG